jgi:hypothetical protein
MDGLVCHRVNARRMSVWTSARWKNIIHPALHFVKFCKVGDYPIKQLNVRLYLKSRQLEGLALFGASGFKSPLPHREQRGQRPPPRPPALRRGQIC